MMSDADFAAPHQRLPVSHMDEAPLLPPPPKSVRETGLELALLVELVAKIMHADGRIHLPVLTGKLRLSFNVLREVLGYMMAEQLLEVATRGESDLDVHYQLTGNGRARAGEFLARSRYAGAAPVTLQAYREQLLRQSRRGQHGARVGAADMAAAFADDVVDASLRTQLGAALQSGRSILLFGPSGSGKTTLARKLGALQAGSIAVPYAVLVDHAIVQIHSPQVHVATGPAQVRMDERRPMDSRWVMCQRPLVPVG
ncbi:MAG: ATP-binding protein, partial [Gammaproteobacteria bacterium]